MGSFVQDLLKVGLRFVWGWFETKGLIKVTFRIVYGVLMVYFELLLLFGVFYCCTRHALEDLALKTNFDVHFRNILSENILSSCYLEIFS